MRTKPLRAGLCGARRKALLAVVPCLLAQAPAKADFSGCPAILTPYKAVYTSTVFGIPMKGERSLQTDADGRFVLTQGASTFGSHATERSRFRLRDNRIRVEAYDMERSIVGIRREYRNRFDWGRGEVSVSGSDDALLPLDEAPLDALSWQLAMRCDFAAGAEEASYPVVRRDRIRRYAFRLTGTERRKTALGTLDTLVVDRVTDGNRSTRVWLAPDLNYLLVRLEQVENNKDQSFVLELEQVSFE
jgi:hypothetical protein